MKVKLYDADHKLIGEGDLPEPETETANPCPPFLRAGDMLFRWTKTFPGHAAYLLVPDVPTIDARPVKE